MNNQDNNNKNEKLEEEFFTNLFEKKEKEQNEQLYKNEFYVLEEEMKTNKDKNSLQFMHDALLNKLMLEDYSPFPPKNDEPENMNDKKKEDEKEKELIKEENEFLRSLHRINYLTFSPFGLSFFDDNFKDNANMSEEYLKDREEKILSMINFDYNKFEVTNDLLLNICQGFVDINKLKEENLEVNRTQDLQSSTSVFSASNNINSTAATTNYKTDITSTAIRERDEPEKDEDEQSEEDFYENINKKRKIDFFKDLIKKYDDEMSKMTKNEKRENMKRWKDLLDDKEKEYSEYQKKVKEEEKKRKEEEKRQKEIERKKEMERQEKMRKEEELKKGLEEIIKKVKKKAEMNKPSYSPSKLRKKPKNRLDLSVKKTLNNSMLSYRNYGNTSSFMSKRNNLNKSTFNVNKNNLNKSVVNRRNRRFSSKKKK